MILRLKHIPSLILITALTFCCAGCRTRTHQLDARTKDALNQLDKELRQKHTYEMNKEKLLKYLREQVTKSNNDHDRFAFLNNLYAEYRDYQSDSAIIYSQRMKLLAQAMGDSSRIQQANLALTEIYSATGLFLEAKEYFDQIDAGKLTPSDRIQYGNVSLRLFQGSANLIPSGADLLVNRQEQQRQLYRYVIDNTPDTHFDNAVARYRLTDQDSTQQAKLKKICLDLLDTDISEHEKAIIYSWLASLLPESANDAIYYYTLSTISDVKSCTRETTAACSLAEQLFKAGETEAAYRYIKLAHEDASNYNTRLRHIYIERVMPLITEDRYELQHSRRMLMIYILMIMLVSTAIMAILVGKLHKKNRALHNALDGLKSKQTELEEMTHSLSGLNCELKEANEIKDTFIRQSLYVSMDFVNAIETRCNEIVRKVKNQDFSSLKLLPYGMGIKEERRRLLRNFDHAFIKLFPNFLDEFNKLFPDDKKFIMGKDNELPPDVRIFALLRIGISDTSAVASFLNISTQSVYVYKTRIKSQSLVDNHEFESRIMEIH